MTHADRAKSLLEAAQGTRTHDGAMALAAQAQVHATLAVGQALDALYSLLLDHIGDKR
jgi:hypothetical protein